MLHGFPIYRFAGGSITGAAYAAEFGARKSLYRSFGNRLLANKRKCRFYRTGGDGEEAAGASVTDGVMGTGFGRAGKCGYFPVLEYNMCVSLEWKRKDDAKVSCVNPQFLSSSYVCIFAAEYNLTVVKRAICLIDREQFDAMIEYNLSNAIL